MAALRDAGRREFITAGRCEPIDPPLADGLALRVYATGQRGAVGLSTGTTEFRPGSAMPPHRHTFSEVLIGLGGSPRVQVGTRRYHLGRYDALHIPAGVVHSVQNPANGPPAVLHWSLASAEPTRELADQPGPIRDADAPGPGDPEALLRFAATPAYELAPATEFRDLFARRLGSRGICGGYGRFQSGASLPCHYHHYDESITIVEGRAVCQVAGREYHLSDNDTACIPTPAPHRFINRSDGPMAMIWVYAGDEPDRVLVDPGYCEGRLCGPVADGPPPAPSPPGAP